MTARSVLIHAGLAKTGTTSIQTLLATARGSFLRQGVSTWNIKGFHSRPLTTAFCRARKAGKEYPGDPARIREDLAAAIGASEPTFILSAEAVSHFEREELQALAAFFRDLGGLEVKLLVYVRRPDRHATSLVQQVLRDGRPLAKALQRTEVLNYPERIGRLFEAFGREAVDVRLCPEIGADDPDALIRDFLEAIGVDPTFALGWRRPENGSLSQRAAMLLSALNSETGSIELRRSYRWLIPLLREHLPGPPFRMAPEELAAILERHQGHIRWLEAETGLDLAVPAEPPLPPEPTPDSDRALAPLLITLADRITRLQAELEGRDETREL